MLQPILEIDLAHFTSDSDWYNYDGSATTDSFGNLFGSSIVYSYKNATCSKPDFHNSSPSLTLVNSMLNRYYSTFGFRGFWMKGILCLRLDHELCESGEGTDNLETISYLRELGSRYSLLFGEDTNGVVEVKNPTSVITNIADSQYNNGLGFSGQLNQSRGDSLVSLVLREPIDGWEVIYYVRNFSTCYSRDVISLNTPETILVCLEEVDET